MRTKEEIKEIKERIDELQKNRYLDKKREEEQKALSGAKYKIGGKVGDRVICDVSYEDWDMFGPGFLEYKIVDRNGVTEYISEPKLDEILGYLKKYF